MEKITKIQFWKLEDKIQYNYTLKIAGSLFMSRDKAGTRYKDNDGRIWLKSDKTGYYADSLILSLLVD